jgi:predicted methyltransferase
MTLKAATEGDWRSPADKARDVWRHPRREPGVLGAQAGPDRGRVLARLGWYTDILAPYLAATGGKLYAASLQTDLPDDPSAKAASRPISASWPTRRSSMARSSSRPSGRPAVPVAPAGSADLVLFLRNLHNWMAAGLVEKAFRDALAALKPGGVLGVEEHRGEPGGCRTCWPPTAMCSRPM